MAIRVNLEKLRALREKAQLTQAQLSSALGYKTALGYHYIETGRCRLRAEQLIVLARILGTEPESLIDGSVTDQDAVIMGVSAAD